MIYTLILTEPVDLIASCFSFPYLGSLQGIPWEWLKALEVRLAWRLLQPLQKQIYDTDWLQSLGSVCSLDGCKRPTHFTGHALHLSNARNRWSPKASGSFASLQWTRIYMYLPSVIKQSHQWTIHMLLLETASTYGQKQSDDWSFAERRQTAKHQLTAAPHPPLRPSGHLSSAFSMMVAPSGPVAAS